MTRDPTRIRWALQSLQRAVERLQQNDPGPTAISSLSDVPELQGSVEEGAARVIYYLLSTAPNDARLAAAARDVIEAVEWSRQDRREIADAIAELKERLEERDAIARSAS